MTKEDLKERFKGLMKANPPLSDIEELFYQAVDSDILDFKKDLEQDYRAATIIYHAILCRMADKWNPVVPADKNASLKLQSLYKKQWEETW